MFGYYRHRCTHLGARPIVKHTYGWAPRILMCFYFVFIVRLLPSGLSPLSWNSSSRSSSSSYSRAMCVAPLSPTNVVKQTNKHTSPAVLACVIISACTEQIAGTWVNSSTEIWKESKGNANEQQKDRAKGRERERKKETTMTKVQSTKSELLYFSAIFCEAP